MNEMIQFHKYEKHFETPPNAKTDNFVIAGALLNYNFGYACLQPWPTLGDKDLKHHLNSIVNGSPSEMAQAALKCCEIDGRARRAQINLFDSLSLPKYHQTLNCLDDLSIQIPNFDEFTHIKIKCNNDINNVFEIIKYFYKNKIIRLDFNSCLTVEELLEFISLLNSKHKSKIDFIEDPIPFDSFLWNDIQTESGLNFALDRGPMDSNSGYKIRIWKPTITLSEPKSYPLCITHNMDHELGMRYATYRAATSKYSSSIHGTGHFNLSQNGNGLGMDEYLESLQWDTLR